MGQLAPHILVSRGIAKKGPKRTIPMHERIREALAALRSNTPTAGPDASILVNRLGRPYAPNDVAVRLRVAISIGKLREFKITLPPEVAERANVIARTLSMRFDEYVASVLIGAVGVKADKWRGFEYAVPRQGARQ